MKFKRKRIGNSSEYTAENELFNFRAVFCNDMWIVNVSHKTKDIKYTSSWKEKIETYHQMIFWCERFCSNNYPCVGKDVESVP